MLQNLLRFLAVAALAIFVLYHVEPSYLPGLKPAGSGDRVATVSFGEKIDVDSVVATKGLTVIELGADW